jgi:hypothetical protein
MAKVGFPIGPGRMDSVSLSLFVGDQHVDDVDLEVQTSDGKKIEPHSVESSQKLGMGLNSFRYKGYIFAQPSSPSEWSVLITAKSFSGKGLLMVSYHDDVQLWSGLDSQELVMGKKVSLTGALIGESLALFRLNGTNVLSDEETCSVDVTTPSGLHIKKTMSHRRLEAGHYLRQTHGFSEAFSTDLDLESSGTYTVEVNAKGPMATRTSWHSFKVVKPLVTLTGKATAHTEELPSHCTALVAEEARETQLALMVQGDVDGISTVAQGASIGESASLYIDLGVEGVDAGRYRVFAELWLSAEANEIGGDVGGGDRTGAADSFVPVCWVGGMVDVAAGPGSVALRVDERWVQRATAGLDLGAVAKAANGMKRGLKLELRKVRLEDGDNYIPVAEAAEVQIELGVEEQQRLVDIMQAADEAGGASALGLTMPSRVMTAGCPPAKLATKLTKLLATANVTDASKLHVDLHSLRGDLHVSVGATSRVALVHGYCSQSVWPAGDFSNSYVFSDHDQSRSHDAFAQLIGQALASSNSASVVAHSQGGLASLQLMSAYYSNLDLGAAGIGRAIQSVGSPYQGVPLAGLLATLGSVFGVGCGSNADLTYDGARRWLAGIPMADRAHVHYYFTWYRQGSFPYLNNYCNLAANAVLKWPNDGVVENENAVLPGGNLVSSGEGQCHTRDMNYMAQCTDATRNAQMNTAAARTSL